MAKNYFPTNPSIIKFYCMYLYWHSTWDSLLFRYYSEGFQAVEHFGNYITELTGKLSDIRQIQDDEKTDLIEVRNSLKNSPGLEKMVRLIWWKVRNYTIIQPFTFTNYRDVWIYFFRIWRIMIIMKHLTWYYFC